MSFLKLDLSLKASATNMSVPNSSVVDVSPLRLTSYKEAELTAWIVVTLVICLVGVINNILILLVTWPRIGQPSGLNLLIFHYIFANLFMCFFNIPLTVFMVEASRNGYCFPIDSCDTIHTIYIMGCGVVNWSDAGLAINRCIALFFPHHYRAWTTNAVNLRILMFSWVVSFTTVLPISLGIGGRMSLLPLGLCAYFPKGILGLGLTTLGAYCPYTLTGCGSLLILWMSTGTRVNRVTRHETERFRKIIVRRVKMARMLLITFVWSGACTLPNVIVAGGFPYLLVENPVSILWLKTLLSAQYSFTPCVLLFYNDDYRHGLSQILKHVKFLYYQAPSSAKLKRTFDQERT